MKRIFLIGIVGALVLALLGGAVVLGVLVTPVRAQIGQAVTQVLSGQPVLSAITQVAQQQGTGPQLKAEKGILVGGVYQGSPADTAGLVRGDVILSIDGTAVNTNQDLRTELAKHKVGDAVQLSVQHGDQQKTVSVTLAAPPQVTNTTQNNSNNQQNQTPQAQTPAAPVQRPQSNVPYLGILPIGAGQFGFKGGDDLGNGSRPQVTAGALITQVATGSPAEKAGLKAGEVITAVDGTAVDAQNNLSTLLGNHKPGDSVKLSVKAQDGTTRDVTVTLGDNPQQAGKAYLGVSTTMGRRGFRFGVPGQNGNPNNPNGQNPNGQNGNPFMPMNPGLMGHPGALVQSVAQASPAEKAGIKQGDLIVAVDGQKISGPDALTSAVTAHKPGDTITVSVFDPTASGTKDVKVTLGDNPQKAGSAWMGISYTYIDMQPQQPGNNNNNGGTQF